MGRSAIRFRWYGLTTADTKAAEASWRRFFGCSRAAGLLFALAVTAGFAAPLAAAGPDAASIEGVWKGTSICVDREVAPACKDEVIVYTFTRKDGAPAGTVALNADKVVDGKREFMGELIGTWDGAKGTWTCEMRTPRWHGVWSHTVAGKELSGTLVDGPTKKVIRRVEAKRE